MKPYRRRFMLLAVCLISFTALGGRPPEAGAELVLNGDFETDADLWVGNPGYVGNENPEDITDWFGTGGRGINPIVSAQDPVPFRDNGDNDTFVALLQNTSSLWQDVTGLTPGGSYILSLDYNARNCCGDMPLASVSLNGAVVEDFDVVFPVLDDNPWYHTDIPFTAGQATASVRIATESELGGDSTLLLDNVQVVAEAGGPSFVANGDFETDAELFTDWPGYSGAGINPPTVQSWQWEGVNSGINPVTNPSGASPFRDNGDNRSRVAFLQGSATLEQEVTGFTVGEEYVVSFDYNSRNCCGGAVSTAELLFDLELVEDFPDPDTHPDGAIQPVGGASPWYHFETTVVAQSDSAFITIAASPWEGGDSTFLIDNISIESATVGPVPLAGDADLNREFNQLDLVKVQIAAKYLTAQAATWGDGDWNGAPDPNSSFQAPPAGDRFFNQLDIISALGANTYLQGPYAALRPGGSGGDEQTSIGYDAGTGEVWVDAPAGTELTSVNIDSAAGIFSGDPAQNLGGSFDNDADNNIFKATFGSSFGTISFGNVAQSGLSQEFVLADLTVVGSLAGGGDLAEVDLIYVPEPSSIVLTLLAMLTIVALGTKRKRM